MGESTSGPKTAICIFAGKIGKNTPSYSLKKSGRSYADTRVHRTAGSSSLLPRATSTTVFFTSAAKTSQPGLELDPAEWHLHRFRDTAATRWLRAGIDVRTVQEWLGHESLATTQKYLEPSKETENQLEDMKLPF
jgi:integrase